MVKDTETHKKIKTQREENLVLHANRYKMQA